MGLKVLRKRWVDVIALNGKGFEAHRPKTHEEACKTDIVRKKIQPKL
jgi:hypothetical protein